MKRIKFSDKEQEYWANVFIAISQVTFGLAWASLFLPLDVYLLSMVVLNLLLSMVFLATGWSIIRRLK